jgi:hypothetical protein
VDGNIVDPEDTEAEEKPKGEMDNSQDLQLGSITRAVRRIENAPSSSLTYPLFWRDVDPLFVS